MEPCNRRKPDGERLDPIVHVLLRPADAREIDQLAGLNKITRSKMLRRLLTAGLSHEEGKP